MDDVTTDLENKIEKANVEYTTRSGQHDSTVSRLNTSILKAKNDISSSKDDLQNVLYPLVSHLKKEIVRD